VKNCPDVDEGPTSPVTVIARALAGSLSHGSLYGDLFHVRAEPNANNIAYTSVPLCPHQDLAYYESKPGLQILHCATMDPDLIGGESVLIDGMAAAEKFRQIAPDHFRTLVTCPATFVKQRDGACMTYLRPHVVLKEGPDMNDIDREIVAVNWSPPFEGPLCLPPDQVRSYYAAHAAFERMIDNSLQTRDSFVTAFLSEGELAQLGEYSEYYTWEHQLGPGDMLIFNNQRMLHGRRGFCLPAHRRQDTSCEGHAVRHLVGGYTNIDDTLNHFRTSCRTKGVIVSSLNAGNGTSMIS